MAVSNKNSFLDLNQFNAKDFIYYAASAPKKSTGYDRVLLEAHYQKHGLSHSLAEKLVDFVFEIRQILPMEMDRDKLGGILLAAEKFPQKNIILKIVGDF